VAAIAAAMTDGKRSSDPQPAGLSFVGSLVGVGGAAAVPKLNATNDGPGKNPWDAPCLRAWR
jgi:hypothetical protein